jgi:hypothetical protein
MHPYSPMQIEWLNDGQPIICERCGFEHILTGKELEQTREKPKIHKIKTKKTERKRPRVNIDHQRINDKNILKNLRMNEWTTLEKLRDKIGIYNNRELYLLRMNLNELKRIGTIQMEFQVNKVLIRKIHTS